MAISSVQVNELINRLVSAEDPDVVRRLYKQWAQTYDRDLDEFGYVAPVIGVSIFRRLLTSNTAVIHDAGCGTGQVGGLLAEAGFTSVEGSDFSEDMLAIARRLGCYQRLSQADYTKPLELKSNSVDGIISIGVYTKRFKNSFLPEMLRLLKAGGYMVFSCRPLYFDEVASALKMLLEDRVICTFTAVYDDYMIGQNACAYYLTLQKS